MLRLKNINNLNPYSVGDKVEFFSKDYKWIEGTIIDFKITDYVYKAIIKCNNKNCRLHYICICSKWLRKKIVDKYGYWFSWIYSRIRYKTRTIARYCNM